jgi:hypothetical protein
VSTEDSMQGRQPTEEEMRAALEEELARVRVEQVVTEAAVSILNVAVMRAGLVPGREDAADLRQVRFGIEAVRALLPLVEQAVGAEQAKPIRDALSQLQLAYVRATEAGTPASESEAGAPSEPAAPAEQAAGEGEAGSGPGPAQQSGRLWVPGQ